MVAMGGPSSALPRAGAWWSGSAHDLRADRSHVIGTLARRAAQRGLPIRPEQEGAWAHSLDLLDSALEVVISTVPSAGDWGVMFEYEVPRRHYRPDLVVLAGQVVVVIEVKAGADDFDSGSVHQVEEYARDLQDFHEESSGLTVVPLLLATDAPPQAGRGPSAVRAGETVRSSGVELAESLLAVAQRTDADQQLDRQRWERSRYRPTPTIIEAAREVYAGHEVRAISHAYADNLDATVAAIRRSIAAAEAGHHRTVCFVTGVPGAGKTLAGLSAVHVEGAGQDGRSGTIGAYLSGNGPLVDVLRYAIAQDLRARADIDAAGAARAASVFIQPVHRFIGELHGSEAAPPENVIVFDEAQRAWDQRQMLTKNKIDLSQAEVTLGIMERAERWAVVVALVGLGQEINRGEAGIDAWVGALQRHTDWHVVASPALAARFDPGRPVDVDASLHLEVSVRSPRARAIADWADSVVQGRPADARAVAETVDGFPLHITRDLEVMRRYLRDRQEADRRTGLLASSQARRLRAFGIEMASEFQAGVHWPRWFVDPPTSIHASDALEVAASEFKCQGLELDWVGLCWGSDLTWTGDDWSVRRLTGARWQNDSRRDHALNRYRVLLTRARLGLVVWVPKPTPGMRLLDGDALDRTADHLVRCGLTSLDD